MIRSGFRAAPLLLGIFLLAPSAAAQQDFSKVEVVPEKLAEGVYMLTGAGGNLGVSVGEDGTFLIDDQYAPLTEKILAAKPTAAWDEKWGKGFLKPEAYAGILVSDASAKRLSKVP